MKQQNVWEMNNQWLQENLPGIAVKINKHINDIQVHSFENEVGWNLRIEKPNSFSFALHSLYNREREYQAMAQEIQAEHRTLVLVGCVSAECLHFLIKKHPQIKHLILVEPYIEVFQAFVARWSLIDAFSVFPKVSLIVGEAEDTIKSWLNQALATGTLEDKKVALVTSTNYRWNCARYISLVCEGVISSIRFSRINQDTIAGLKNYWLLNTWYNLQYGDAKMEDFAEVFRGQPAILVSAGPSLDKNIHLLKEASQKSLIVAVGSAMTILESHGIRPHFRVAIDPGEENEELFMSLYNSEVPLLYSEHLYYKILAEYRGPKIQMNLATNSQITDYLYQLCDIKRSVIPSGFSVANVAAGLLAFWKCNPIVFVGQDLSYTDGRLHGAGSWDDNKETAVVRNNILRKDIYGNDIYTDAQFEGMREIFERIINACPEIEFLNATEGGVPIKGARNRLLYEVLAEWETSALDFEAVIASKIEDLKKSGAQSLQRKILRQGAIRFESEMKSFLTEIEKNKKFVRRLLKKEQELSEKEVKQLLRNNQFIKANKMYKVVYFIFEENFRVRRESRLQQEGNCMTSILQAQLFLCELCDLEDYVRRFLLLISWYINGEEFKVVMYSAKDKCINDGE